MDPNEALKNARKALETIRGDRDGVVTSDAHDSLADAFESLDGWLSKGGFMPNGWNVPRDVCAKDI